MIIASLIFSAAAVLFGLFTKLPQSGGGIVHNLMAMSGFLPSPPYLPDSPPPPKTVLSDVDTNIFDPRKVYVHHYAMTCNITEDPMPQCPTIPRPSTRSSNPCLKHAKFAIPIFSPSSLSSLSPLFLKMGNIVKISIALCLPWLACTQLRLLAKIQKATDNSLVTTVESGDQWHDIELHNRMFCDLQVTLSEHKKALAEAEKVTIQAKEDSEKAMEREHEMEQRMQRLEKERDDAFEVHARCREEFMRLSKVKENEVERIKEETMKQVKAWQEKENDWEEKRERDERGYEEDNDGLKMSSERERESWKGEMDRLRIEKGEEKERMEIKIKDILEEKEQEREIWAKEKEGWKKEKENFELRNAVMESEKMEGEQKAAKINSEGEREQEENHWEKQMAEAKKLASKLEQDLLNGRKLVEDLQTDKRIDRQLLLELRAQLLRPTHSAPPAHLSPFRFGGTTYAAMILGAPIVPLPFATSSTSSPQSPIMTLPPSSSSPTTAQATLSSTIIPSDQPEVDKPIVRLPPINTESRTIDRLPPPRQITPSRLPARSAPPPNAPIGPKGWTPNGPQRP